MTILFKALLLLPLLLVSCFAKRSFHDDLESFQDNLEETFGAASKSFGGGNVAFKDDNFGRNKIFPQFINGNANEDEADFDAAKLDSESQNAEVDGSNFGTKKQDFEIGGGDGEVTGSNDEANPGFEKANAGAKLDFETNFKGMWKLETANAGVAAMHMQLLPNNKAIWFDTTALGDSAIKLTPAGTCPANFERGYADCFAHGIEYDIETSKIRTLKMASDPWCSSGALASNGDLISTGGFNKGIRAVRIISPCENCEFQEKQDALSADRWYASQQMLEDGNFALVGGRRAYNYEIIPQSTLNFPIKQIGLPFLEQTTDTAENNLYPFVFLTPDGNLFVFANNRAILLDPQSGKTVREFPPLPGGSRNYPASGMSALIPIDLTQENKDFVEAEVLVCGGNQPEAFAAVDGKPMPQKKYLPALQDCGRISITKENAQWIKEDMPSPRVMGDMLILPTGDLLLINGAKKGTSGWWDADEPNLTPVIYSPNKNEGERFKELNPSQIPRMYHSCSAVLPDGKVLVAGGNENSKYDFKAKFPTELRVEKFSPPYLDPVLANQRPEIVENNSEKTLKYGAKFTVEIKLDNAQELDGSDLKLTMLAPPFTTHGFSQNHRMLILRLTEVTNNQITAVAPPSGKLAPPGYYLIYVVHRGVPSRGMWVQIA